MLSATESKLYGPSEFYALGSSTLETKGAGHKNRRSLFMYKRFIELLQISPPTHPQFLCVFPSPPTQARDKSGWRKVNIDMNATLLRVCQHSIGRIIIPGGIHFLCISWLADLNCYLMEVVFAVFRVPRRKGSLTPCVWCRSMTEFWKYMKGKASSALVHNENKRKCCRIASTGL